MSAEKMLRLLAQEREDIQTIADLRVENKRLRETLELIARRGVVADAKGTWSKQVHDLARSALTHHLPERRKPAQPCGFSST